MAFYVFILNLNTKVYPQVHTKILVTPLHLDMDYDNWFSFTMVNDDDNDQEEMDELSTKPTTTTQPTIPTDSTHNPPSETTNSASKSENNVPPHQNDNTLIPIHPNDTNSLLPNFPDNPSDHHAILTTYSEVPLDQPTSSLNRNQSSIALNSDITWYKYKFTNPACCEGKQSIWLARGVREIGCKNCQPNLVR